MARQFKPGQLQTGSLYNISSSYALTASYAMNGGGTSIDTGSLVTTASFNAFTASYGTGSFTGSFTGTLTGTASYATQALSASYAPSTPAFPFTGSALITGSLGVTGSFIVSSSIGNLLSVSSSQIIINGPGGTAFTPTIALRRNGANAFYIDEYGSKFNDIVYLNTIYAPGVSGITLGNQSGGGKILYTVPTQGTLAIGYTSQTTNAALDIKAQGALSTDIAFRVRNSADTADLISFRGNGSQWIQSVPFIHAGNLTGGTNAAQSLYVGYNASVTASTGTRNTIIGTGTGLSTNGNEQTAIGWGVSTGGFNTSIAIGAGATLTANNQCIIGSETYPFNTLQIGTGGTVTSAAAVQNMIFSVGGVAGGYTSNTDLSSKFFRIQSQGGSGTGNSAPIQFSVAPSGSGGFTANAFVIPLEIRGDAAGLNHYQLTTPRIPTSSLSDGYIQYSADRNGVAGKASPHFRTEDGTVVWLGDESRLFNVTASAITASSVTASLQGTASYATQALSASYAPFALTASYSQTASYVLPLNQQIILSGSFKLDPTQDPDPTGIDLDSTVFFQSSSNTALGYDLYVRQNGNLVKWKWIEGSLETGLLYGGAVTYSGSNVFVSPGSGIIADHNATTGSEVSPMIEYVTWNAITQSITNIATQQVTYLYIDNNGALQQQSTRFTSQQYHDYIPLGAVGHFDYTQVSAFGGGVQTAYDQISQISNFVDAFGPLKMSGYGLTGQAGSLRLSVGAGTSFIHGGFYQNNPEFPSQITTPSQATASLARVQRSGSVITFDTNGGNLYTVVDPTQYDRDGDGILHSVGSGNWSIQRVFTDPKTGVLYVYYGQARYTSLLNALQYLPTDPFTEGDTFDFTTFVGFLVLKGNASNITDTANNSILNGGLFRGSGQGSGGGIALSNLDDLTDVSIVSPTNGQALVYNSGIWQNSTPSLATTASYVLNAVSASYAPDTTFPYTGSARITGSLGVTGSVSILAYTASADSIFTVRNSANSANLFQISGDSTAAFGNTIYSNVGLTLTSTKQYNGYFEGGTTGIYVANNSSANTSKGIETLSRINNLAGSGISSTGVTTTADGGSTTSAHYGIRSNAYGSGTNYAGYFDVVNGVNNYAIVTQRGFSGFGQTAPAAMVDIKAAGALSTDVAFRVRNSADNKNIMEVRGDSETRWNGSTAVGNYVGIKNYTSYDATIDLMGGSGIKAQISLDPSSNQTINRGLNIWNPGIVGSSTAKINNVVKSGLGAYGQGYGFNWAFTSNADGIFTQAERAMWLTWQNSLVFYTGSSSPIDYHVERSGSFEIFASSSTATNDVVPHFKTQKGTTVWLGAESRLFNVTASNMMIGATSSLALFTSVNSTVNVGTTTLYAVPTASYDGVFIDYTARSGSNARAGQLMGIWSGSAVNYTETTTTDFGSTSAITFGMSVSASSMIVSASATTAAWTVKTIIRSM